MSLIIFGAGPMPCEPDFPVTAPGSRTWQIVRTAACGAARRGGGPHQITVVELDERPGQGGPVAPVNAACPVPGGTASIRYFPLPYQAFEQIGRGILPPGLELPADPSGVIATGSAQPYSTAAGFARARHLPLWVDVFGDPLCETQSQAEIQPDEAHANAARMVHVWKLLLDGLLQGDRFSALSERQRYALLGQLGCAGRLNQFTAMQHLAHSLPYALFPDECPDPPPHAPKPQFNVLWCGSFNTWMDVDTLAAGLITALKSDPRLRLTVVGGRIAGYNEISYRKFVEAIHAAGIQGVVTLMDWQPLSAMRQLYAQADIGLSIDRFTYEAELGSRTRLVNFLAAGVPVLSTSITELAQDLEREGYLMPFELGNPESLSDAILMAAGSPDENTARGAAGRQYILSRFDAMKLGEPLIKWTEHPAFSQDKNREHETAGALLGNPLTEHWVKLRAGLN